MKTDTEKSCAAAPDKGRCPQATVVQGQLHVSTPNIQRLPRGIHNGEYGYRVTKRGQLEVYLRRGMHHITSMSPYNRRIMGLSEVMRRVLLIAGLQPCPPALYEALGALTDATLVLCDGWLYSDIENYQVHDILDDLWKDGKMTFTSGDSLK